MGLLARYSFLSFIALFQVLLITSSATGQQPDKPDSIWMDKELKSEIISSDESFNYVPPSLDSCVELSYYTRNLPLLPYSDKVDTNCALKIGIRAYIDGENLLIDGGIAGKHYGIGRYFQTVEGADALIVKHGNGIRFINDFTFLAEPDFNFITGRLNYTLPFSPSQILYDASGRQITWNNGRISGSTHNGNIFIDQSSGSFVRINERTGDTKVFGSGTYYRSGGTTREKKFVRAVANGRYVIVAENKARAVLYDLDRCSGEISRNPINDVQSYYSEACDYIHINDYLSAIYNDDRTVWIEDIDFDSSSQIEVIFGYRDYDNVTHTVKARIVPEGYEFTDRELSYVALGDSFASGEGDLDASWYELGTDVDLNKCHLSMRSYPYLLADILSIEEFHSVACSGAIIEDVISGVQKNIDSDLLPTNNLGEWYPGIKYQNEYLEDATESPIISSISISGNDAGFSGKLAECAIGTGTCKYAEEGEHRSYVAMEIASLKPKLIETYQEIYKSTDNKTKLFAMSYPKFIKGSGGSCGLNVHLNDSEREFVDNAVELINEAIRSSAQEVGAEYINIEDSLANYNLCSYSPDEQMAVNGLTKGDDILGFVIGNESYHPNQRGHELIADTFLAQTNFTPETYGSCGADTGPCNPQKNSMYLADESYWGESASKYVSMLNENSFQQLPARPQTKAMIFGNYASEGIKTIKDTINVVIDGLKPSSWVDFVLNSEPLDLGRYQADNGGLLYASITIPNEANPGVHTLNAYADNTIGDSVHFYEHVAIGSGSGSCGFISESGVDQDNDSIDDACDPVYVASKVENNEVFQTDISLNSTDVILINASPVFSSVEVSELVTTLGASYSQAPTLGEQGEVLGDDIVAVQQLATVDKDAGNQSLDSAVITVMFVAGIAAVVISLRILIKS